MSTILKIIFAFVGVIALVVAVGVTGLSFYLWPTSVGDGAIAVTPQTMEALTRLRGERKFVADQSNLYFGAPNETVRLSAQRSVDVLLDSLVSELPKNPKRSMVLAKFKAAMESFSVSESEERDQFLVYLQRIMRVLGMPSSGELMNVWRYGFPYGWFF
ncbi:DUF4844 domain-containing protein [Pseudoduganella eburnea]|uniref:DUF4844 domain-containing protein n=1 Tax=Massilia eburnea TaxID=1776165 RepID=A0A6L6QIK4_9BURK|nr:DUF4844 domain-containing protein [Massilia eburnea]MTW11767.1 DUF4844 domain-containing protein [Massilia eburnea]